MNKIYAREDTESTICTVDSYANGISFGKYKNIKDIPPRERFFLRIEDSANVGKLQSRYAIKKDGFLRELEEHLRKLSRQGVLPTSEIYFGVATDPFFPFEGKFDTSMKFLELFKRYVPAKLFIQTRSPLVVIALPVLKSLGKHVAVTFGIETCLEHVAQKYTPELPRLEERWKAVKTLRTFGVEVSLQVSPLLPYGDWKKDAHIFAEKLVEYGDSIYIRPMTDGSEMMEQEIRGSSIARKLAQERKFYWLRHDSVLPLTSAIEKIAPEKLRVLERKHLDRQLSIFAA